MSRDSRPVAPFVFALLLSACGKGSTGATPSANPPAPRDASSVDGRIDAAPEDPRSSELWARASAADADADDLERLYAYVGSDGLVDAIPSSPRRMTALRALAFADDFMALPRLAKAAASGTDDEASAALESIAAIASRPRRATDPEDALEVHEGCAALLVVARITDAAPTSPRARRVLAVRALRLLADRGWVPRADVPTDVDAR